MTGLPTVQVLLDDGTGTFPLDVSSRLEETLTISSYGRTDEFTTAQSAELQLTLDNADGAVATGVGFPGGNPIAKGQGIQVKVTKGATTRTRFTGKISGADLGWVGGSGKYSQVTITAMDRLTDLAGADLRSVLEEEMLARGATAYYTLGEELGSVSAGDTSGGQSPALRITGPGAAAAFSSTLGLVDGATGVRFAAGQRLEVVSTNPFLTGDVFSFVVFFTVTAAPAFEAYLLSADSTDPAQNFPTAGVGLKADGRPFVESGNSRVTGSGSVIDGHPHCVGGSNSSPGGTDVFDAYVDGVAIGSSNAFPLDAVRLTVGDSGILPSDVLEFNGIVAHVALFNGITLSAADHAEIAAAGLTGFLSETTDNRFARIVGYIGTPASSAGMSTQTMGVQLTAGQTALEALQEVAEAEGGFLFADGAGTIRLQGRNYRSLKTAADLTLDAEELSSDTGVTLDNQQQVKQVTTTRPGGATQVAGTRTPGVEDKSLNLVVDNDADALSAAQWIVAKHSDPGPRLGSGLFGLLNSTNAELILAREIGDRLSFINMATQVWPGFGDVTIEGWTESIGPRAWSLTANLLPWSLAQVWVLGDATFGQLGVTTQLGY